MNGTAMKVHVSFAGSTPGHVAMALDHAVAKAGGVNTTMMHGQDSEWFVVWSKGLRQAAYVVVVFCDVYRQRFTRALQKEAAAILELHTAGAINLYVFDPAKASAAEVRCNLTDGVTTMGDVKGWLKYAMRAQAALAKVPGAVSVGAGAGQMQGAATATDRTPAAVQPAKDARAAAAATTTTTTTPRTRSPLPRPRSSSSSPPLPRATRSRSSTCPARSSSSSPAPPGVPGVPRTLGSNDGFPVVDAVSTGGGSEAAGAQKTGTQDPSRVAETPHAQRAARKAARKLNCALGKLRARQQGQPPQPPQHQQHVVPPRPTTPPPPRVTPHKPAAAAAVAASGSVKRPASWLPSENSGGARQLRTHRSRSSVPSVSSVTDLTPPPPRVGGAGGARARAAAPRMSGADALEMVVAFENAQRRQRCGAALSTAPRKAMRWHPKILTPEERAFGCSCIHTCTCPHSHSVC